MNQLTEVVIGAAYEVSNVLRVGFLEKVYENAEHMAQCINYLRATELSLALILDFQKPRVEIERIAL